MHVLWGQGRTVAFKSGGADNSSNNLTLPLERLAEQLTVVTEVRIWLFYYVYVYSLCLDTITIMLMKYHSTITTCTKLFYYLFNTLFRPAQWKARAKDVSLSSLIELLSQVFRRRKVENERSDSADETGITRYTFKSLWVSVSKGLRSKQLLNTLCRTSRLSRAERVCRRTI